ncbi:FAD-binding oxidoreductase [Microbacterium ulmi]|uniref:FAD-binding oxidoreductase n=1 Tax=Microbacterium ulmi TaxID=179095 RepID=A0A7Y2LWT9_9MICO|nr:FAD-binding protein [Microbacterium ulmi]NII68236.1 FAD/FMN-containing dehydrogenase [Microbacterium ulmi]NNH02287.1 FAD-binding oxidoreductase [Microbacterium ulmi]
MDITSLRSAVTGPVLSAEDAGWDAARLSRAGLGAPDVIVHVSSVDDVCAAVRFAAASRRPAVLRSGGHSAWCTLDDGILIDLSGLDAITILDDPAGGAVVSVGGGAHWGAVARALAPRGLAISSGDTASVGVGGLTLGGGIGWMVRAWGLAADQLIGAQLVTAEGDVVEASAHEHPELFWALRGGGGNFGVVTRFDFHAHAIPGIVWARLGVDGDARPVLAALRDLMADAPRALTVTYMHVPAMDPSAPAGASISAVWIGDDPGALRAALSPILALDGVTEHELRIREYPGILLEPPLPDPAAPLPGFIGGNTLVVDLDESLIDGLVAFREASPATVLFLRSLGGAYGDLAQDETPFPARGATWFAMAGGFDIPGAVDDAERARLESAWDAIEARGAGVYGNFSTTVDPAFAARMYPPETMARLAAVKRRWDPRNLFSRNHNVAPV